MHACGITINRNIYRARAELDPFLADDLYLLPKGHRMNASPLSKVKKIAKSAIVLYMYARPQLPVFSQIHAWQSVVIIGGNTSER
jgi:hypothetical protein